MNKIMAWDVTGSRYRFTIEDDSRSESIFCKVELMNYLSSNVDWVSIGTVYSKREYFPKCINALMSEKIFPFLKTCAKHSDNEELCRYYLRELQHWATLEEEIKNG